jgi:hypothetical protein
MAKWYVKHFPFAAHPHHALQMLPAPNTKIMSLSQPLTPQDKIQTLFTLSSDSYVLNTRIREDERQL